MTSRRRRQTRALAAPFTGTDPSVHNFRVAVRKARRKAELARIERMRLSALRGLHAFTKLQEAFRAAGGAFAAFQGSVGRSFAQQIEARSDHERRLAIVDESPGVRDEIMLALKARYGAGLTVVHPTRPMTTLHNA
ncbi:MAG: hypothetical protein K0Q52_193 [Microbacterium sp.]|nr:hypothetical protein [Microbacterium sp.]